MRWLWQLVVALVWPVAGLAQTASPPPPPPPPPPPLVLDADQPVITWINGLEVALALSTGTVDHVTLNDSSVRRIGLSAAPADNLANLVIGGRNVLPGRHGKGWLAQGGALVRREYYWFPGQERLPLAGTIGPFALPHWRVRVEWPAATGPDAQLFGLPLIGGIDNAAYGLLRRDGLFMAVGVDVRTRRALPLVTAATGADLAASLGGQFVGEAWQEEILLGVSRPVRRLVLARPLMIGPIRIDAVAVRQGGPRDATMSLERGQLTPLDAEEDPEIMAVRGRILKQRRVARYITLSRTQLETAGCTSLMVDKAELRFELSCAPPLMPPAAVAGARPMPVPVAAAARFAAVLPDGLEARLAIDAPVDVRIDGQPLRLLPGDAGAEGLLLDARTGQLLAERRLGLLRGRDDLPARMGDLLRRRPPGEPLDGPAVKELARPAFGDLGVAVSQLGPATQINTMAVALARTQWSAQAMASWITVRGEPDNSLAFDGRIAPAALPVSRLSVGLGAAPARADAGEWLLPIADRSHDQAVMGVMAAPGIDALFVGLEWGPGIDLPVVSMALGQDLIRLHGGREAGDPQRVRMADRRLRLLQPLALARPLAIGPLRLELVLVEQAPATRRWLQNGGWSLFRPLPDLPKVAGLEREVRLPLPVLRAAGCFELLVDKPARDWRLRCNGPVSAPPAP